MTDGCNNCKFRLELQKWDYRSKGCEHTKMEGFVCTALTSNGVAIWLLGWPGCENDKCECWEKRKAVKWDAAN